MPRSDPRRRLSFVFSGSTGRSNSKIHIAQSNNKPSGGLYYRSLCGVVIATTGGGEYLANCKKCVNLNTVRDQK